MNNPKSACDEIIFQTLIRILRDTSTRVTLVRPALWQMDTALVDQAVEKFNLQGNMNENYLKTALLVLLII